MAFLFVPTPGSRAFAPSIPVAFQRPVFLQRPPAPVPRFPSSRSACPSIHPFGVDRQVAGYEGRMAGWDSFRSSEGAYLLDLIAVNPTATASNMLWWNRCFHLRSWCKYALRSG